MAALDVPTTQQVLNNGQAGTLARLCHHNTDGTGSTLPTGVTHPLPVTNVGSVATNTGNASATTQRVVIATDQPTLTNAQPATAKPATSGGLTAYRLLSAATLNKTSVKGSAGQLYRGTISNTNAAARYFKLYNKASAPDEATDTPVMTVLLPAGAVVPLDFGDIGLAFSLGIGFLTSTGVADTDANDVAANEIVINLAYA